ncbi:MAG: PTS sugar transporter subunit IIA [Sphaerochaetaceae bacterium]|jgi:fructose-specific phosphotransferase system IIA component
MKIKDVLSEAVIATSLKGETKNEIIEELLDILVASGKVEDRQLALDDLLKREKQMSTGIQHGVAIPHAKTKAVKSLAACIAIKPEGVDFAALDGQKSNIFIMTLSPVDRVGPHVQFLAEVSMVIKEQREREKLLNSKTKKDILSIFGV